MKLFLALLVVGLLSAAAGAGIDHALQASPKAPKPKAPSVATYRTAPDLCVHRQSDGRGYFCEGTCESTGNAKPVPVRKANYPSRESCLAAIDTTCAGMQ